MAFRDEELVRLKNLYTVVCGAIEAAANQQEYQIGDGQITQMVKRGDIRGLNEMRVQIRSEIMELEEGGFGVYGG